MSGRACSRSWRWCGRRSRLWRRHRRGSRQILRQRNRRRIERFVDRWFGRGRDGVVVSNFALIHINEFLERRPIFLCDGQLILKCALLLRRLRHFLRQLSKSLLDCLIFPLGLVPGLMQRREGSLGFAHDIRIPEFQLTHLSGENPLFVFGAFEFRSRGDSFLQSRVVGALGDASRGAEHREHTIGS